LNLPLDEGIIILLKEFLMQRFDAGMCFFIVYHQRDVHLKKRERAKHIGNASPSRSSLYRCEQGGDAKRSSAYHCTHLHPLQENERNQASSFSSWHAVH
jgi:hypothetical protein